MFCDIERMTDCIFIQVAEYEQQTRLLRTKQCDSAIQTELILADSRTLETERNSLCDELNSVKEEVGSS